MEGSDRLAQDNAQPTDEELHRYIRAIGRILEGNQHTLRRIQEDTNTLKIVVLAWFWLGLAGAIIWLIVFSTSL